MVKIQADDLLEELPPDDPPSVQIHNDKRMPLDLWTTSQADQDITRSSEDRPLEQWATLGFYQPMTCALPDLPRLQPDEIVVFKVNNEATRRVVVKRDDDLLTTD